MTETKSIRPKSLPEILADDLRQRILLGAFCEGYQLRQEALAKHYSVSRMPVREALRQLEAEGLVQFFQHRGAVVSKLSLEEIWEVFHLRALIECDLLERAIPQVKPEDIEQALSYCAKFDQLVEGGDRLDRWGELNWKLHHALYKPSGLQRSLQIAHTLHNQADRYVRLQLVLSQGIARASREHRELIELSRRGKVAAAVALLKRHIQHAGEELIMFLKRKRNHPQ
jgi:DNA-binding GntR family transcriptional regulator